MTEHSKITAGRRGSTHSPAVRASWAGRLSASWSSMRISACPAPGVVMRSGFARLTSEVALARVGIVLGLEVSRLARNNADWHRLIELAGLGAPPGPGSAVGQLCRG